MSWGAIIGGGISAIGGTMASRSSGGSGSPRWLRTASRDAVERAKTLSNRGYRPYTGERVAPLGENETMAGEAARGFGAALQPFQDRLAAGFTPGALSSFENPYIDRVLANQRRVIGEEYGRQSSALQSRQSAMDAFRSGRSDLARSRLDFNRLQALGDAEASGRAGAFDTAMRAFQTQQGLDLGALGQIGQNQVSQIGVLGQTGATERGVRQAGMDFDYGQFLEGRDWDVNNFGILLDAIRAAQGGAEGSSGPSTASMLTGLLGTAVSNGAFSGLFNRTPSGSNTGM